MLQLLRHEEKCKTDSEKQKAGDGLHHLAFQLQTLMHHAPFQTEAHQVCRSKLECRRRAALVLQLLREHDADLLDSLGRPADVERGLRLGLLL